MKAHRVGLLGAALALSAAPAAAQLPVPLTPRSLSMGGAYVGVARGQEALWQNPANLALPGSPHWSFAIPSVSVGYSLLGLDPDDVMDLSDFGGLEQDERDAILAKIPELGTDLRGDVRVPLAALQLRRFAIGLSYATLGNHTLEKDIVDLLLNGPVLGRNDDVTPGETQGFRATYVDVAAAHARRFGAVSVGATAHYYYGVELVRSGITAVQPVAIPTDVRVRYSGVTAGEGSGFGLDLGVAFQPRPEVTVSASVSNLVNTFSWGDERTRRFVELDRTDYQNSDFEQIWDEYNASEAEYTPATSLSSEIALAEDLEVDTELPRVFRAGVAWRPFPASTLAAAYQGNLDDSRIGGLWEKSFGVGWEQRLHRFVGLRAGVASNLDDGSLLSAGVNLGPLNVGIARLSDGEAGGADRKGWIATFGLSARSNSVMP